VYYISNITNHNQQLVWRS